mmetsp:Transcript_5304/g.8202  ORF Transcript_5304/g.8202 Transcript_5304/m.8202 type:complete len:344 (-) Transcript_5304:138-1169(-)
MTNAPKPSLLVIVATLLLSVLTVHHVVNKMNIKNNNTMATATGAVSLSPPSNTRRQLRLLSDPKTVGQKPPKILHLCLLGDPDAPPHMTRVAQWISAKMDAHGFKVMIWTNKEAEALFDELGGPFHETWEYTKLDPRTTRNARMADYLRLVLMYHFGGVYLDVDILPCHGLGSMTESADTVSFPYVNARAGEIVNCAISAPPKHPVIQLAIENIFAKGSDISEAPFLKAAGPQYVSVVVDEYFESKGISFPKISKKEAVPFPFTENSVWTTAGNVRFADFGVAATQQTLGLVHLHMGSWFRVRNIPACETNPDLIPAFLDRVCGTGGEKVFADARFSMCGAEE